MKKSTWLIGLAFGLFAAVVSLQSTVLGFQAAEEAKPKYTIKEVMKTAHKDGLLQKVLKGEASPEEKMQLLDLYVSLPENKPPKGESDSWNQKTAGVVIAVAKVVVGREGADAELRKATNCNACHSVHRPAPAR